MEGSKTTRIRSISLSLNAILPQHKGSFHVRCRVEDTVVHDECILSSIQRCNLTLFYISRVWGLFRVFCWISGLSRSYRVYMAVPVNYWMETGVFRYTSEWGCL